MSTLNVCVIVKLEPDFSEGNFSYNADGTLNRAETKSILGVHSAIACDAAFYSKVKYGANITIGTMGPPFAEIALQQAQLNCCADQLYLYSDRIFAGADTLATAEVLKKGIHKMKNNEKMDIVFSGHRASDGETGQTGPQTAWKLGYTFLGNVIDYEIDPQRHTIKVKRLISIQGLYDIIEEVESPLPVFISVDPTYKARYITISQRLLISKYRKEAEKRSIEYRKFLTVYNAKELEVDPKFVGLPGSPTIVYKVERIPKVKTSRKAEIIDGKDINQIRNVINLIEKSITE